MTRKRNERADFLESLLGPATSALDPREAARRGAKRVAARSASGARSPSSRISRSFRARARRQARANAVPARPRACRTWRSPKLWRRNGAAHRGRRSTRPGCRSRASSTPRSMRSLPRRCRSPREIVKYAGQRPSLLSRGRERATRRAPGRALGPSARLYARSFRRALHWRARRNLRRARAAARSKPSDAPSSHVSAPFGLAALA